MRRRVSLFAGLVLLLISSGCTLSQVFLYGLLFEIDFPPGVWTKFACFEFGNSPFEIVAGPYEISGLFNQDDRLPKKLRVRYQIEDHLGQTMQRMTHQYTIGRDGSFTDTYRLNADFVVPVGYYLCMYLLPKRNALIVGALLEFLNYQNSDLVSAADGSPDPRF